MMGLYSFLLKAAVDTKAVWTTNKDVAAEKIEIASWMSVKGYIWKNPFDIRQR